MEELNNLIQQVEIQSKRLKNKLNEKNEEIAILQEKIVSLTQLNKEKEAKLIQMTVALERKDTAPRESEKKEDLQERVNELVREIDECIAHLKQ